MLLYFSGTGNTKFVAQSLANLLGEECKFIPEADPDGLVSDGKHVIFCFPIYSWGVPPLVLDFIDQLPDSFIKSVKEQNIPVSMVCTCGDEVACAPEMFIDVWIRKGIEVRGIWNVIMPNNYVLLPGFSVDPTDVEQKKLEEAPQAVRAIADAIRDLKWETDVVRGSWPKFKTKFIYPLFKRWGMNPRKWKVSEECVHCGRCVAACPVGNMKMKSGSPYWGCNCVSCTSCYQHCPTHAISYQGFTKGKGQYYCRLHPLKKLNPNPELSTLNSHRVGWEGIGGDLAVGVGDDDLFEGIAVGECHRADRFHRFGDVDLA